MDKKANLKQNCLDCGELITHDFSEDGDSLPDECPSCGTQIRGWGRYRDKDGYVHYVISAMQSEGGGLI